MMMMTMMIIIITIIIVNKLAEVQNLNGSSWHC